jgi:ABC-type glutathione transport system ATPase component
MKQRQSPQSERMPLLEIKDLHVEFPTQGGVMHAVEGVSLTLERARCSASSASRARARA